MTDQPIDQIIEIIRPCAHGEWNVHKHKDGRPVKAGDVVVNVCVGATRRQASPADLVAALVKAVEEGTIEGEREWYCEAYDLRQGVSEPCESGSTHDAPDFDCHWRVVVREEPNQ